MKTLSQLFLLAAAIALVIGVILALAGTSWIATPNGWLDLSLVCAVMSIAVIAVFKPGEKEAPATGEGT